MPPSPQSKSQKSSPSSPSRRLLSPQERFGSVASPEPSDELAQPEENSSHPQAPANEPGPTHFDTRASRHGANRSKARHERHHFDREEHRYTPHRVERKPLDSRRRRNSEPVPQQPHEPDETLPADLLPSPTLLRIRAARKRFWRRFAGVSATLAVAGATWALLFAPEFNIERVKVSGLRETSPELVKPLAATLLERNAIRAPKAALVRAVEKLPTVAAARVVVRPSLPPVAVLQVRERTPLLRLGDGASWWVVDAQGMPYRSATARDAELPALTWKRPVQTMKRLDESAWDDARQLVAAIQTLREDKTLPPVREATLDEGGDATLVLRQNDQTPALTLQLGNDAWPQKVRRARVALAFLKRTGRDACELNLVSLRLPRWTPRIAPSTPNTSATT